MGRSAHIDVKQWDTLKRGLMYDVIKARITEPTLKQARFSLLSTDGEIIDDCFPDDFWGDNRGQGQNNSGKLYKQLREELLKNDNC